MMANRRHFLQTLGLGVSTPILSSFSFTELNELPESDFWKAIRQSFPISKQPFINLNSGAGSNQPYAVIKSVNSYYERANELPIYDALEEWGSGRMAIKERLGNLLGCRKDELALTRNTTEGLCSIINGLPLPKKSEIVVATHDYQTVVKTWEQRAERDRLSINKIDFDLATVSRNEIIESYEKALNKKTALVVLTEMTHREGAILPVREIAEMAKAKGIRVMVDAAHSFAHSSTTLPNCDYWATSLHKWLCAPYGTGLLYVKKERIADIQPLFLVTEKLMDSMIKFEAAGTRAYYLDMGIAAALDFYETIGIERKTKRLQYLKNYWTSQLLKDDSITFLTQLDKNHSCGMASFYVKDKKTKALKAYLKDNTILVKQTTIKDKQVIRVSPNVYTNEQDLDFFVEALKRF